MPFPGLLLALLVSYSKCGKSELDRALLFALAIDILGSFSLDLLKLCNLDVKEGESIIVEFKE